MRITKKKNRHQIEDMRRKWTDDKRRYLANLTEEKNQDRKRKRRLAYAKKKLQSGKLPRTAATVANVVAIPPSPQKFASSIKNIITNTTPQKRKALTEKGVNFHFFKCRELCKMKLLFNVLRKKY